MSIRTCSTQRNPLAVKNRAKTGVASAMIGALTAMLVQPFAVRGQVSDSQEETRWSANAVKVHNPGTPGVTDATHSPAIGGQEWGGIAGSCNATLVGYSNHDFVDDPFVAQGGFVATEIAAVSYVIPAIEFPVRIDLVEALIGTLNPQIQITTHWSLLVWQGTPNNGTLVATISSNNENNPPHMVLSPPTNSIHLQAGVDPGDPDQIVVANNGSNTFSVGIRIDQHNQPASSSCPCLPGFPELGSFPPICCPPPSCCNIFPTTDTNGLSQPSRNWLFARNCPGATGFCDPTGGWVTSGTAGISGDWIIRTTYTPSGCTPIVGACCLPNGSCLEAVTTSQCSAAGGVYQGNNVLCVNANCPQPGACCLPNGTCLGPMLASACVAQGGTYQGAGSNCGTANCPQPVGTCCTNGTCQHLTEAQCVGQGGTFISSQQLICSPSNPCRGACCIPPNTCSFVIQPLCAAAGGVFQGIGILCSQIVCFPIGACCLPNGTCLDALSPSACQAQGGAFQGNATTCNGVSCPVPKGACCVNNICVEPVSQEDCTAVGGTWLGSSASCETPNVCSGGPACPADVNHDDTVNIQDLLLVIGAWGNCPQPCTPPNGCAADVTDNCIVNIDDLLVVIADWGPCR